jgi:hypothetical protein
VAKSTEILNFVGLYAYNLGIPVISWDMGNGKSPPPPPNPSEITWPFYLKMLALLI